MSTITVCCEACGATIQYQRWVDPSIPAEVVKIVQPHCPNDWNGDFEGETWYDAAGQVVHQNELVS